MAITRTAMTDDDGTGTTGTILNNAWKQEFYNQIDAVAGGAWTRPAFSAARYTAPGGTWTVIAGNEQDYSYSVIGRVLFLNLYIAASNITGSPTSLNVALPAGFQCSRPMTVAIIWGPAGTNMAGFADVPVGATAVSLRSLGGAIVGGANTGYVYFSLAIPI